MNNTLTNKSKIITLGLVCTFWVGYGHAREACHSKGLNPHYDCTALTDKGESECNNHYKVYDTSGIGPDHSVVSRYNCKWNGSSCNAVKNKCKK